MSDTVRSYGFIALLKQPLNDDELDLNERFYDDDSPLRLSYDGTLVFIDFNLTKSYSERTDLYHLTIGNQLLDIEQWVAELRKYDLEIQTETTKPYDCIWYDGGDCPVSSMTKNDFLAHS